ncbi:phenylacetate--CoA ligase family protein [Janthinobacterium lividum]|uniref:Phenylacetate--CoA ligase family protein n=1 Tax=Janthinobacterium lividum TaxID=29581 RepID=A0ABU0XVU9_9BURK|nr:MULTISPECIES: phenylacetate--CoA ligase family protein [Janthinobacterium]MBR7635818.1 phenylacetate--CoA ligase family protein [Janthinobacterium lividum]MDQ4627680.1 phenylacetate--CoA ligase family protein [Janthinobacterium lividum]MDQ4676498.1 phenylacetate--CoA ligase family protein [Janthinobacterium lividum]MDQ4687030.1 phenylacetate--CoA ligase family protein [Janthinobacterium lividum]SDH75190.1 phenylacetate-CoA ligase [Janthinobacterium sp. YR213]
MKKNVKKELFYGLRSLLRDNFLSRHLLARLRRNAQLDQAGMDRLQLNLLHATLQCAIDKLPYYAHIDKHFPVGDTLQVLRRDFPIIDKSTLLANRQRLYPNGGKTKPWYSVGKTSGTTGTPLTIFRSPLSVLYEMAFVWRHWECSGFRRGARSAVLRGDVVVPQSREAPPFWFYNRHDKQLMISSRHLKEGYMAAICDQLDAYAPAMLQAYPSTAFTLASYLQRQQRFLSIPLVFTSSEPLYPHQRALIEERFRARVSDMYGMAERVAFASACEFGAMHVNADYAYVEIVDDDGQPTTDFGFVVGTTLHNHVMPLVRYRLSDRARWKTGACACGRPFPVLEEISGKYEDAIFGGDGQPVSPSVLTFAFKGVEHILKSQVAQVAQDRWQIRIVPAPAFSKVQELALIENIRQLVDKDIMVEIVLTSDIPNTSSVKFRWVVNEHKKNK